jgi:hypothetical protein
MPSIHLHRLFAFVESALSIRDSVSANDRVRRPSAFRVVRATLPLILPSAASPLENLVVRCVCPISVPLPSRKPRPPWRRSVTAAPSSPPHPIIESATPCPSRCWPPELHQPLWWPPPWYCLCPTRPPQSPPLSSRPSRRRTPQPSLFVSCSDDDGIWTRCPPRESRVATLLWPRWRKPSYSSHSGNPIYYAYWISPCQGFSVTPGFGRQTECEPCTCQDQKLTYTSIT